jgi:hypothetical protein
MSRQAAQLSFKTAGILEVCRGFSRRINAEFGTKDFLRWLVIITTKNTKDTKRLI